MLKNIVIAMIAGIVIFSLLTLLLPSKVIVERGHEIHAPVEVIFDQVNNLHNWSNWSPWDRIDPKMVSSFDGPEAGVGAKKSWKSEHERVGNGSMKVIASHPYDSVVVELDFLENGKALAKHYFKINSNHSITARWVMETDVGMNPIGKAFGLLMDKMVGPDFEKGLASLDSLCQTIKPKPTGTSDGDTPTK